MPWITLEIRNCHYLRTKVIVATLYKEINKKLNIYLQLIVRPWSMSFVLYMNNTFLKLNAHLQKIKKVYNLKQYEPNSYSSSNLWSRIKIKRYIWSTLPIASSHRVLMLSLCLCLDRGTWLTRWCRCRQVVSPEKGSSLYCSYLQSIHKT